jgi:hypothetical protein
MKREKKNPEKKERKRTCATEKTNEKEEFSRVQEKRLYGENFVALERSRASYNVGNDAR